MLPNPTYIFKWYIARLVVRNGHQQDTCYSEIRQCQLNIWCQYSSWRERQSLPCFFGVAKIEKINQKRTKNNPSEGEPTPRGELGDDAHLGPDFPSDHKIVASTFNTPNIVEFIKRVLVSNVRWLLQVQESMLSRDPTIVF